MRRYIDIYSIMLRNSLIREMSFKANFLLWMMVEVLWFCGQIVFFSIIFGNVDRIGDWTKWEVVLLVGTHQMIAQLFQAILFRQRGKHSRAGAHRKARLAARFARRQPVCRFDKTIWSRQRGQRRSRWRRRLRFLVQTRHRPKSDVDLALSDRARFRRRRALLDHAQPRGGEFLDRAGARLGLRLLQFSRTSRVIPTQFSRGFFGSSFGWIIPVVIIANIPARLLIKSLGQPGWLMLHLVDRLHNYLLLIARFLAFCPAPLLQRQLVRHSRRRTTTRTPNKNNSSGAS